MKFVILFVALVLPFIHAQADEFEYDPAAYPEFQGLLATEDPQTYLEVHPSDFALGFENAPVTIIEYFSLTCSYCRQFHEGTFQSVWNDYIETGLVRFVLRDFPRELVPGLETQMGAMAQCFERDIERLAFLDSIYANQSLINADEDPMSRLVGLFDQVSQGKLKAENCMSDTRAWTLIWGRKIQAQLLLGVSATPTIYMNGERFTGDHRNYNEFRTAIDDLLITGSDI